MEKAMNILYRRNDINEEGYILCVGKDNEMPICIQNDNIYPFETYSFEDALTEYPECFTELGELNEALANTIIDYTAYAHKINEIDKMIQALHSSQAISRYDYWYNNGGHLPDNYIAPEAKEIQSLENELTHLLSQYQISSGKEFTTPDDIFKKVSADAKFMQADLQEEDELDR